MPSRNIEVGRVKMTKYGMVVDVSKCNGCYNCFLACKDEYCGNDFTPYSLSQPGTGHAWMKLMEKERGQFPHVKVAYTAIPCLQCEDGACLKATSEGVVYRREDGIILIDPAKAKDQKQLVSACPYRRIYWNEEKGISQKCTFCAHLLDQGWKEPRCVEACPTGALVFGDLEDPQSEVSKLIASGKTEALHPEYGLNDKVRYIGLPKRFIAGSVVYGDTDECGEGARVTLTSEGEKRTILANNYGDFEFEGLTPDKTYTLKIEAPGYKSQTFTLKTTIDIYLGDIFFHRVPKRVNSKVK
jgi:Fe-S-cluster-containing dehydrogenase component